MCKISNPKDSDLRSFITSVLTRYRNLYKSSVFDRSTAVKARCLEFAVKKNVTEIMTEDVFYREFARRIDVLLDSTHFVEACKSLKLDSYSVATHVVVQGKKEMEDILFYEGYKALHPFPEWKDPIIPKTHDKLKNYLEKPGGDTSSKSKGGKKAKAKKEKSNAA